MASVFSLAKTITLIPLVKNCVAGFTLCMSIRDYFTNIIAQYTSYLMLNSCLRLIYSRTLFDVARIVLHDSNRWGKREAARGLQGESVDQLEGLKTCR
jgi:hypothetical protein